MVLNYHELTMNEPKDSPQKKKQFAVTCSIMAAVIVYSLMTSGALLPINPEVGTFPGGNYCYKFASRDYSSSVGLSRQILKDLLEEQGEIVSEEAVRFRPELEEISYHVFLDNPRSLSGKNQRYASGILVSNKDKDKVKALMGRNDKTKRSEFTKDEMYEMSATKVFNILPYEKTELPSVDALVLQFPYTSGLASMLVQSNKVLPKMHKLAAEKGQEGNTPVVITTCNREQQMCTHYAPLSQGHKFLFGRPDTETHKAGIGKYEGAIDWYGLQKTILAAPGRFTSYWGISGKSAAVDTQKEEL
jgi:hypothetical protein